MEVRTSSDISIGDFVYTKGNKNKIYKVVLEGYSVYAEDMSFIVKDVITNSKEVFESSSLVKIEDEERLKIIRLLYLE